MNLKGQIQLIGMLAAASMSNAMGGRPLGSLKQAKLQAKRNAARRRPKVKKHITDASRWAARWKTEHNAPAYRLARHLAKAASQVPGSMRGSDELRIQRLRRAYGVTA